MKTPLISSDAVGVIVGRFQVPELHEGHRHLFAEVFGRHNHVLVVLGSPRSLQTARNPLPYEVREAMIKSRYTSSSLIVREIFDHPSDEKWSQTLDALVRSTFPDRHVVLYGSRDSFLSAYSGTLPFELIAEIPAESGTECREKLNGNPPTTRDFRSGVIHAINKRLPIIYQAIDVAIIRREKKHVLLGRKKEDDDKWRFPGGFLDENDLSLELAAKREAREEVGFIEIDDLRYVGSTRIDDWRYRNCKDGIMTTLFTAEYIFGGPKAGDDIDEVAWFAYEDVIPNLAPAHLVLGEMLMKHLS